MPNKTLDDNWLEEIKTALSVKPRQVVIPALLAEEYERFHTKAIAHAITSGEHEAMMYLSFYVIWKKKLYEAKYGTWRDYCAAVAFEPYNLSASTVKHKVIDIDRAMKRRMKIENIILGLGNRPMATRKLLELPQSIVPDEKLDETVEGFASLSSSEAMAAVRVMANEPTVWCKDAVYVPNTGEYMFTVVVQGIDGSSNEFNQVITDVSSKDVAKWLFAVMKPRGREIK